MYKLTYKSWGDALPIEMPKLFFTCCPGDFSKYFDFVCENVFRSSHCAIYHTTEENAEIPQEARQLDILGMNLFIIPVTLSLLTTNNRAIDEDLPFAQKNHIPVLPIMMEPGLDSLYSSEEKFGKMHYLTPAETSDFGLGFTEKLDRYLQSVLIRDNLRQEIVEAFDAHIFMSYRRVDRLIGMEFMRWVHRIPQFRDIAIWYDEFLIPGEDFSLALKQKIKQCDIFTLIVTQNLINNRNSYVFTEELPEAKTNERPILAVNTTQTDISQILNSYDGQASLWDDAELAKAVLTILGSHVPGQYLDEPSQLFYMGAAYLWGVNVEVDRDRALALLIAAGENNILRAQYLLQNMYEKGSGVQIDYFKALYWAERLVETCKTQFADDDQLTIAALKILADSYDNVGRYKEELKQREIMYEQLKKKYGETDVETLRALSDLGACYESLGRFEEALERSREAYKYACSAVGEESELTIVLLGNIANILYDLMKTDEAIQTGERACELACRIFGKEHRTTLYFQNNQGYFLMHAHRLDEAEALLTSVYTRRLKTLGEGHPETYDTLDNLASVACERKDFEKGFELEKRVYEFRKRVLGEEHPATQRSLLWIVQICSNIDRGYEYTETLIRPLKEAFERSQNENGATDPKTLRALMRYLDGLQATEGCQKAMAITLEMYEVYKQELGEKHSMTLEILYHIGNQQFLIGDYEGMLANMKKCYEYRKETLGEKHPDTIDALAGIAIAYSRLGEGKNALRIDKIVYDLRVEILGENHPDTLQALNNLGDGYLETGDYVKAEEIIRAAYEKRRMILGDSHRLTIQSLYHWSLALANFKERLPEAIEIGKQAYALEVRLLGRNHPTTMDTLVRLASFYYRNDDYLKARELAELAYKQWSSMFSERHPLALEALSVLSDVYGTTGEIRKANAIQKEIYEALLLDFSPDSKRVRMALMNLASSTIMLEDTEQAQEYCNKLYDMLEGMADDEIKDKLYILMLVAKSRALVGDVSSLALFHQVCIAYLKEIGESAHSTIYAYYEASRIAYMYFGNLDYAFEKAQLAYELGIKALGPDNQLVQDIERAIVGLRQEMALKAETSWKSAIEVITNVKAERHFDRLLMGRNGQEEANKALESYANAADISEGFAVLPMGNGFLGLGKCRGVLLTEEGIFSDQLSCAGIMYDGISHVLLEDLTVTLVLFNNRHFKLTVGASGPDLAAVLQAVVDYTQTPKG